MPEIVVRPLDIMTEAEWSFRTQEPRWQHRPPYGSGGVFDPFPGYRHQLKTVEDTARWCESLVPPLWDVELYVADREEQGRSNGYSNLVQPSHYEGDEWVKDNPIGLILLSGKRVPPHPAVTRYLVAHEYGHNVEWMLNQLRGAKNPQGDELIEAYAKVRELPDEALHHGSGGRWHDSATEIFACDFRVLVCRAEAEYWPHPGVPEPGAVPGLAEWWKDATEQLRSAP